MDEDCTERQHYSKDLNATRAHLLQLPNEVRNRIFELALAFDSYHKIQLWPVYKGCDTGPPPLALTSRQIRQEALPVYSNQASICMFAYANDKWQQSKVWLHEQSYFVREMKLIFTKYAGDILTIKGFVGQKPTYDLTLIANTRRMGDHSYEEDDLREFVESHIDRLMDDGGKNWFGVDEYTEFGDAFLNEYYEF